MALESTENVLPPVSVQEVLVDIYFSRINTLLPLVDEEAFRAQFSMEILPPQLIQAICLVATKESGENLGALRLGEGTDLLGIENFKNTLYNLLVQCISRKESRRTVTQIQVHALLSLHTSGPDSTEDASLHLMQAIHHAQTLGLHLINKTNEHQDKAHILLFWSLWSLDRWNAAINGRPVLIGNSDMQPNMNEAFQCGRAPFRIWLRLAETLDQVIGFYRPTSKLSLFHESTFTGFEQIVEEAQGYLIPKSTLISLELLYHGISILSCGGQKGVTISNSMKIRESFATTQIVSIIHSNHAKTLLALPMIPYSISLSLCWSYNKLRKSKLLTTRHMARSALETCCRVLSEQKMLWWFAGVISRLGQRALDELGQDPSAAASSEIQEEHFDLRYGQQITSTGYEQTFCQPELPDAFRPGEGNRGLTLQESVENNMGHSSVGSIGDFHRMLLDLNMPLMSGDLF
ncbi:fungal specific transcription factor domain-containing protein [Aspergillus chevalieri]|uniref:Xylanolytic transcriptional activator regulatory domain-containing protein n=1 Tax=Aspergillus chevalieri TaxID=182096 RepID=A0A7R7ZS24_ASPCH|nr:uncharacterized protein ACHE_70184S [Aspergillus chevalieri]BCR91341.1 hypothetical protein ACHE_70184S [Aspergillus chevalieri]